MIGTTALDLVYREPLAILLDSSIRSAAAIAATGAVAFALRGRAAALRHALWIGAICFAVLAPVLSLAIPRWPVPVLPAPASHPVSSTRDVNVTPHVEANLESRVVGASPAPVVPAVLVIWFVGAVFMLVRAARAHRTLGALRRRAAPIEDFARRRAVRRARVLLPLRRTVAARESGATATPMIAGWPRPTVILPAASASWSAATLNSVLLHELDHVRRHDVLWHRLASIAAAVYWFHPLVWWAVGRARLESERAADEAALATGERPSRYARALLRVAAGASRSLPPAAVALSRGGSLRGRIERILASRARRAAGRREWLAMSACAVAIGGFLAVATPVPAERTPARDAAVLPVAIGMDPGAPVEIVAASVVATAAPEPAGSREVLLVWPKLSLRNHDESRAVEAVILRLDNRHNSNDVIRVAVAIAPGKEAGVRIDAKQWSNAVDPGEERDLRISVVGVRFGDGTAWSAPGTILDEPSAPAPPSPTPNPRALPALPALPVMPAPSAGLTPLAPTTETTPAPRPPAAAAPLPHAPVPTPAAPLPRLEELPFPREGAPSVPARFRNPSGAPAIVVEARTPLGDLPEGTTHLPIVTIRNDSNRRIEGLRLRFKAGTETHAVSGRRVNLAPGSTYVYRSNALLEGDPRAVTVQLLGVRFEDGGTWGTLDSTIDTRTPWIGGEAPPVD